MSLVHSQSCESVSSGLDLFTVPITNSSTISGGWVEYHPLATISPGAPIQFAISGSTTDYLDFSNTYLHVKAKIVNVDGTDLAPGVDVAPVNYWMHSLFSQVDVSLNDVLVTPSENTYPYRAYIETMLNYGREAKQSYLTGALWYRDSTNHFDETAGDENKGLRSRREIASRSKEVDMMGRLHTDMCHQERYMLNGVDIKVRLVPSKNEFHLMAPAPFEGFRTVITHCSVFARKVKVNPAVGLGHAKALEKGTAKYPLKRAVVKTFSIPTGNLGCVQDNLFLNQTPNRLVIGVVTSAIGQEPLSFSDFAAVLPQRYLRWEKCPSRTPDSAIWEPSVHSLIYGNDDGGWGGQ